MPPSIEDGPAVDIVLIHRLGEPIAAAELAQPVHVGAS